MSTMMNEDVETAVDESEETVGQTEELVTVDQATEWLLSNTTNRGYNQLHNAEVISPIELARTIGVKNQMIYNYISNGAIKARLSTETGHKVIDLNEAVRFVHKRLNREAKRQAKIQAELEGEA